MKKTCYVDPMIGTVGDEKEHSFHGGGKTHPGACYPFGMMQLSPDTITGGDNGTGYNWCNDTIEGFSVNHMSGIGWYGDLGNLQMMPIVGETDLRSGSNSELPFDRTKYGWRSPFSHERECARAGYYSVFLDRYQIGCEATVSEHCGQLRFIYPESAESGVILNFSRRIAGRATRQRITIDGNSIYGAIECNHQDGGFGRGKGKINYTLYFSLTISKQYQSARFFENEALFPEGITTAEGEDLHLLLRFPTVAEEVVCIMCGISYTDLDGAKRNLSLECPSFDFEGMYSKADSAWEKALGAIDVEGKDEVDLTLFYTSLYHTLLDPRCASDCDGRVRFPNGDIKSPSYRHRTMFSGWDVYRSEFPLLTLIYPNVVSDEVNSLIQLALTHNSSLPRWELMGIDSHCMTGDPGTIVMADAYCKGIRDFDVDTGYQIALSSAKSEVFFQNKPFLNIHPTDSTYIERAFVVENLSSTLEYLLSDFALSRLAASLGKVEDEQFLSARVASYKENYNPETGFMGPRDYTGEFLPVKDEYDTVGCIESNIFQQSFFVPYDVEGLSDLFGKKRFFDLLEALFEKADLGALWNENYNHSNEPCHNLTHYFSMMGKPERTAYWTRRVQKEAYRLGPFGFCGNEDVGQLSAWYVLSAIGFAQCCMCDERFYINTPLFKRSCISLNQKYHSCAISPYLLIECDKDPLKHPYISEIQLNGRKIERNYLTYSEITSGGTVKFMLKK